jgi:hypothetical protein
MNPFEDISAIGPGHRDFECYVIEVTDRCMVPMWGCFRTSVRSLGREDDARCVHGGCNNKAVRGMVRRWQEA